MKYYVTAVTGICTFIYFITFCIKQSSKLSNYKMYMSYILLVKIFHFVGVCGQIQMKRKPRYEMNSGYVNVYYV